jgi:excinuclease ABC subunit A
MTTKYLTIHNATEHNLKNVSLKIPRYSLTVITGLSGSGKSSLAFDTVFKEGQRRYIASLSAYARQFMHQMDRPAVEMIEGLSPTICIDQKSAGRNPRSTVGTITEIYDFLRLLYSRLGTAHCPKGHGPISGQTSEMITDRILTQYSGQRIMIMAPVILGRKGEYRKELNELKEKGFTRVFIDGLLYRLDEDISLARYEKHSIELVLDRLSASGSQRSRIQESVVRAIELAEGKVSVIKYFSADDAQNEDEKKGDYLKRIKDTYNYALFNPARSCSTCGLSVPELEPRLFSFNVPQGACPQCSGLGYNQEFDPSLFIADENVSVFDGALKVLNDSGHVLYLNTGRESIVKLARQYKVDIKLPWKKLPAAFKKRILTGAGSSKDTVDFDIISSLQWLYNRYHIHMLERYMKIHTCPECEGSRLNKTAISVLFLKHTISDLVNMQIITLERRSNTLSGGEAQRIRLAAQIGSGLEGCLYVLDEPSIGLHQTDNKRLIDTLKTLRDKSNTIFVIEHDEETMLHSDHLVDVGPFAGVHGGEVCFNGKPENLLLSSGNKCSQTKDFLNGKRVIPLPKERRNVDKYIHIKGAEKYNLKKVNADIPLGVFCVIAGVSGSGKSTLIMDILRDGASGKSTGDDLYSAITGLEHIDKVIEIDQKPIGRTPRSNPATYTKAMTIIRDLFALLPEAKLRGYKKGRFSFNVKGGRCEHCGGAGVTVVDMQMFQSAEVACEICNGKRFNANTLDIHYKGKTISQILEMTIGEAVEFFKDIPRLSQILSVLCDIGMEYVKLGQPSTTLSGGEAQRIKLASELSKKSTGKTLYILDEPTTGLHFEDIKKLLSALQKLVDAGNTVIVIEHNLDVIKTADYVIELGPGGGDNGGKIIAAGTPEAVAKCKTPTGKELGIFLKRYNNRLKKKYLGKTGAAMLLKEAGKKQQVKKTTGKAGSRHNDSVIILDGLRKNNLKNISIKLPKNKIITVTGLSGSGKSSLAFDTVFREGQRKYIESLSTYARRFLGRISRPEADSIEGISPTIAVDQKAGSKNPRSTVATQTEIYDSFRVLFTNAGVFHCPECEKQIYKYSPSELTDHIIKHNNGQMLLCKAPLYLASSDKTYLLESPDKLLTFIPVLTEKGYIRLQVNGKIYKLDENAEQQLKKINSINSVYIVLDRLTITEKERARIYEVIERSYDIGEGVMVTENKDSIERLYSVFYSCQDHDFRFEDKLTPRHFSFNHYSGACSVCKGIGKARTFSEKLFIRDPDQPFLKGAIYKKVSPFFTRRGQFYGSFLKKECRALGIDLFDVPYSTLSSEDKSFILYGKVPDGYAENDYSWKGVAYVLEDLHARSASDRWRDGFGECMEITICPKCHGGRLHPGILAITVGGKNIAQITHMNIREAADFFKTIETSFTEHELKRIREVLDEINFRLSQLLVLGLYYITLDRMMGTLSGGEAQRIRLSTQIGNKLNDVIYVLDEPTIGLHERDTEQLLEAVKELRQTGNTILMVEHDGRMIRGSDWIVDLGPGAGSSGGTVMYNGPYRISQMKNTSIYHYMKDKMDDQYRVRHTSPISQPYLHLTGVTQNNIKNIDIRIPSGCMTGISGVSGSGKSSLLDWFVPRLRKAVNSSGYGPDDDLFFYTADSTLVDGLPFITFNFVDQTPVSVNKRSIAASYIGVTDMIRDVYSSQKQSNEFGFTPGHFSFNSQKGRCPACEGRGEQEIEMHFLSDVSVVCDSCGGKRYNRETLNVFYRGKNISDVMNMTFLEASDFFSAFSRIINRIQFMLDAGLGYLTLGIKTSVLSGGELQRLKLARELSLKDSNIGNFYILDEPTTGLHFADVKLLVGVLDRLVQKGNTVLVVEHNRSFLRNCDYIIDMGPEGGNEGGTVVAQGTPEEIIKQQKGHTWRYL